MVRTALAVVTFTLALSVGSVTGLAEDPEAPGWSPCTVAVMIWRGYVIQYNNCMATHAVLQPEYCYGLLQLANQAWGNVALYCDFDS